MTVTESKFGHIGNEEITLYTLKNNNGMEVKVTNYGGIVTSIIVPDSKGTPVDVVLGFDSLQDYLDGHPYFGCLVGRYANRIANGEFNLDGVTYQLAKNNGPNSLHGGLEGFDKKIWRATSFETEDEAGVELRYLSPDGEEGYPGNMDVRVIYSLNNKNEMSIKYLAYSQSATIVNLTYHGYFNLDGQGEGTIFDQVLYIDADSYTVVNDNLIPTGELRNVAGGPMDFLTPKPIGKDFDQVPGGYDHNYVLNTHDLNSVAARLVSPKTGIVMEVHTDQPGIQFYSGNFLDGSLVGKRQKIYLRNYALCLETQHFPDSPNQPSFPSTVLLPGDKFESQTIYKFSTKPN